MAVATAHEVDLDVLDIGFSAVPAVAEDAPDLDVDPDGLFVFCEFSGMSARTQGGFCLHCGACNHEDV